MTDLQRDSLASALGSREVQAILARLQVRVQASDVDICRGYPRVLHLKSRGHQIEEREKAFAQAVCVRESDDVLLLGNTEAIEGFLIARKVPIQLKGVGEDKPDPPPGGFVQAFLNAWQKARGWRGVWLYVDAPRINVDFARRRWNTAGTEPKLKIEHLNNQIGRVCVRCSDGWIELPIQLATGR